ncbi:MAG TPA: hypothetical protein VF898_05370 [Chloroflexota bacterium]
MTQGIHNLAPVLAHDEEQVASASSKALQAVRMPATICVLQIVLAYEWLVSGLDKIGNTHFDNQLVSLLQQSTQGNRYGWYVSLVHQIVLPNHTLFALLDQGSEIAIGIALLLGGGLGLLRPQARITVDAALAASAALLGSTFLALNYFVQGNTLIPWINPANAFVPGVDINSFVAVISLVLFVANVCLLLKWRNALVK